MTKFELALNLDHEAFRDAPMKRVAEMLRQVAADLDRDSWHAMRGNIIKASKFVPSEVGTYAVSGR
jgi:hypothetical protein